MIMSSRGFASMAFFTALYARLHKCKYFDCVWILTIFLFVTRSSLSLVTKLFELFIAAPFNYRIRNLITLYLNEL